jgi:photosystem II stability/assembly factor-like uncharacterized protein
MRALALLLVLAAGCASKSVCEGQSGTCVDLTVDSPTITALDGLHIVASGALTGTQDTSGTTTSLPLHVALRFHAGVAGVEHLDVDGRAAGTVVGSGMTDFMVVDGQHTTAKLTLTGGGGGDLGIDDLAGTDGTDDLADLATPPCDPKGTAGPQCVWRWQTPLPQGDDFVGLVAFSDNDIFALTKNGLLLHRDASAWSALPNRPAGTWSARSLFGSGTHLFIGATGSVGGNTVPLVFHSPDKGITWMQETLPAGAMNFAYSGVTDGSHAILAGEIGNMYIRDAVAGTWSTKTTGGSVTLGGVSMLFGDAVAVGFGSAATGVGYSTDYGATWTLASSVTPAGPILSGSCVGRGSGQNQYWAVGNTVILHSSGPTPSTWTQQGATVTASVALQGCSATDDMHVWAWGTNGVVLVTTNGGTTWTTVATPPATTLTLQAGGHSPSGTSVTVVGDKGALFRAPDGAAFASEQKGPQDALSSVHGVAPGKLFAVGAGGTIYRTTDGGAIWTKLAIPSESGTTADLISVWGSSINDVYAVGNGVIVHSTDGLTFQKYTGILPAMLVLNDVWGGTNGVFAAGQTGTGATMARVLLHTTTQGASWSAVTISGYTDTMGSGQSAQTTFSLGVDTWVAGDGGKIYHSTDGSNFSAQNSGVTAAITRIRGVNGHLLAGLGTDPGAMLESSSGGTNWTPMPGAIFGAAVNRIAPTPSESSIFVAGPTSGTGVSTDKGGVWGAVTTGIIDELNAVSDVFPFADNDVFLVGDRGIVHYGN